MKIELNIEKKQFWMLLSALVVLSMIILVYAYGTSVPATFGHSAGEVDVDIGGQAKTLQQAITDGDFVSVDTDTKCDAAGNCAQVCVGSDCKTAWPVFCTRGPEFVSLPCNAGYAACCTGEPGVGVEMNSTTLICPNQPPVDVIVYYGTCYNYNPPAGGCGDVCTGA